MTLEKIQITRDFPYPIATVFKAFTDQEGAKNWLAPDGFTCPNIVYETHIGGRMHTHFVDDEGNDATSEGVFTKIVPNSLIEYEFQVKYLDQQIENLRTQITFEPTESGTKVTAELHVPGKDFAKGCTAGWNQSLDNLENYFGKLNG